MNNASIRPCARYRLVIDQDLPGCGVYKTPNDIEQSTLATSAGSDEGSHPFVGHVQSDVVQCLKVSVPETELLRLNAEFCI